MGPSARGVAASRVTTTAMIAIAPTTPAMRCNDIGAYTANYTRPRVFLIRCRRHWRKLGRSRVPGANDSRGECQNRRVSTPRILRRPGGDDARGVRSVGTAGRLRRYIWQRRERDAYRQGIG